MSIKIIVKRPSIYSDGPFIILFLLFPYLLQEQSLLRIGGGVIRISLLFIHPQSLLSIFLSSFPRCHAWGISHPQSVSWWWWWWWWWSQPQSSPFIPELLSHIHLSLHTSLQFVSFWTQFPAFIPQLLLQRQLISKRKIQEFIYSYPLYFYNILCKQIKSVYEQFLYLHPKRSFLISCNAFYHKTDDDILIPHILQFASDKSYRKLRQSRPQ